MRGRIFRTLGGLAALTAGTLALVTTGASPGGASPANPGSDRVAVCGPAAPGYARCHSWRLLDPAVNWRPTTAAPASKPSTKPSKRPTTTTTSPTSTTSSSSTSSTSTSSTSSTVLSSPQYGYSPAQIDAAYGLPGAAFTGTPTVAIVDAYDDPNAESDLGVYRSKFGLAACTTANGCFSKVNQSGGATPPAASASWAQEISLDVDMVSAACPSCHILLVEASSSSLTDLGTAVNTAAATPGVTAISNSYGAGEFSGEASYDGYYTHPGIAVTVSSGDNGYGVQYPAASPHVTAVGGTSLYQSSAGGYVESAWSGAGSGCSAVETKPSWQTDSGCSRRTVADTSAVADPNTGVAVYDSYGGSNYGAGWMVFGGTSVASPIVATTYALGAVGTAVSGANTLYAAPSADFHDVTSGSNGRCSGSYLCTAGPGYDGPTGLGTPNGTSAF